MARSDRTKASREAARARKAAGEAAQATGNAAGALLRDRFQTAVQALSAAETQIGRQIQALMKEKHLTGKDASAALRDVRKRLEKERKKAARNVETTLAGLQARLVKEGQAFRRSSEEAMQRTLGALNVPSRQDISRLTRKVDELSKKIDRMRPARRRR
jgi:hypothetical protein